MSNKISIKTDMNMNTCKNIINCYDDRITVLMIMTIMIIISDK